MSTTSVSSTDDTQEDLELADGRRGGGGGEAKSNDSEKSFSFLYFLVLWSLPITRYHVVVMGKAEWFCQDGPKFGNPRYLEIREKARNIGLKQHDNNGF